MYTKSAADLRHYIIHMYEEECIIYEEVVSRYQQMYSRRSSSAEDDRYRLSQQPRFGSNLSILLFCRADGCRLLSATWLQVLRIYVGSKSDVIILLFILVHVNGECGVYANKYLQQGLRTFWLSSPLMETVIFYNVQIWYCSPMQKWKY